MPTRRKKKKLRKQGADPPSVNRTLLLDTVMTSSTDPEHLARATRGPHRNYSRSRMYKLANVIAALGAQNLHSVAKRKVIDQAMTDDGRVFKDSHEASFTYAQYINGAHPQIWLPERLVPLAIDFGVISGPLSNRPMALPRHMHSWNPSIAMAPAGLCPRCKYAVAIRVEPLHQCDRRSPLYEGRGNVPATAYFRGTALAILDPMLKVLAHTWMITAPKHHIDPKETGNRWTVPFNVSDNFAPPWSVRVLDTRLFNYDGRLFATYACKRCVGAMLIHVYGDATSDGGVHHLRAFRQTDHSFFGNEKWAAGRNQAFFAARRTAGSREELFVQPWLGVVGSFGTAQWEPELQACKSSERHYCGTFPVGGSLWLDSIKNRAIIPHFEKSELIPVSPVSRRDSNTRCTSLPIASDTAFALSAWSVPEATISQRHVWLAVDGLR
jgi:hypothetical protein